MSLRSKLLVSLALQTAENGQIEVESSNCSPRTEIEVSEVNISSTIKEFTTEITSAQGDSQIVEACNIFQETVFQEIEQGGNDSVSENKEQHSIENYSKDEEQALETAEYEEDSDDSVKDKNYVTESSDNTSDSEDGGRSEENDSLEHEHINNSYEKRPKKGRKRKYEGQDRRIRQKLTNSNQPYYSAKGKHVLPKPFIAFICSCQNKCSENVSIEERQKFFNHYWSLADYNVQTTFISTCVRQDKVKRKVLSAANPERRQFSRVYKINNVAVCRDMFIKTIRVSTKRINTALRKVSNLDVLNRRGVAGGHNKMSVEQRDAVISHINKFPRYVSHYCRATKNKQEFLAQGTTLTIMYKLYKEEHANAVSLASYRRIFLTEFNLRIKSPKKDTCNKCDSYENKIKNAVDGKEKEILISEHNLHLQEAETARNRMKADLMHASENETTETLTFDMEKTLPLPRLTTNIIFYKRQLWLYNCGIRTGKENKSVFNIWVEGQAGRGAQEVGSCLRKYVTNNLQNSVRHLILWSDSCGGQNRNIKMVLLLKCILEETTLLKSIRLRFLVSGHSFLPNDSDFGDVECALKRHTKLFCPEDYVKVMQSCRRKNPIEVAVVSKEDFVSTQKIEKQIVNRKKNSNNEKINWLHIRELKVLKDEPHSIFIKTNYDESEEFQKINIRKEKGRTPMSGIIFSRYLEPLWPTGKPIAEAKLKDIQSYLHLIPANDHGFYNDLKGDNHVEEDVEGYNGELDFELEQS